MRGEKECLKEFSSRQTDWKASFSMDTIRTSRETNLRASKPKAYRGTAAPHRSPGGGVVVSTTRGVIHVTQATSGIVISLVGEGPSRPCRQWPAQHFSANADLSGSGCYDERQWVINKGELSMRRTIVIAVLVFTTASIALGQRPSASGDRRGSIEQVIRQLDHERIQAQINADA